MEPSWQRPEIPETAGMGVRFVAFIVDVLLSSGIFLLLLLVVLALGGVAESLARPVDLQAILLPLVTLWAPTVLLYFTVGEARFGATVGKQLMDLRTVRDDGSEISLFGSFIRNALRFLWLIPLFGLIFVVADLVLMYVGEMDQRLGDLGAQTLVIRT